MIHNQFSRPANATGQTLVKRFSMVLTMLFLIGAIQVYGEEAIFSANSYGWKNAELTGNPTIRTVDDITFNFTGGSTKPTYYEANGLRTYENCKITISGNATITSIAFTYTIDNSGSLTANIGTWNSTQQKWTGSAESITFTVGHNSGDKNGQVRITQISVTYTPITSYTVNWTITPTESGTLSSHSGLNTIVTPNIAYTYASPAYTVITGEAIISQNGNTFTANPTQNSAIQINMVEQKPHTVTWYVNGVKEYSQIAYEGTMLTDIPNVDDYECNGKVFVGWTTLTSYEHETEAPVGMLTNTEGLKMPNNNIDYYAVFATPNKEEGEDIPCISFLGGTKSDLLAIEGITAQGLGSDYAENNAPYRVKLDNTGDYILYNNKHKEKITRLFLKVKMIGGAETSTITIQTSDDDSNYTNISKFYISGNQNTVHDYIIDVNSSSKYIRLYYTKGSNIGLGNLILYKPAGSYLSYATSCSIGPKVLTTPTNLQVADITATSATLSWTGDENASSYAVFITDGTNNIEKDVTTTSITISELSPNTDYIWDVKAIGDGINYADSEPSSQDEEGAEFTTLENIMTYYTITFVVNSQEYVKQENKYSHGDVLEFPEQPSADEYACNGYSFEGWTANEMTKEDTTEPTIISSSTIVTTDITYYAVWKKENEEGEKKDILYASFDDNVGTGGNDGLWSDNIALADIILYEGWSHVKGFGAKQCIKLGSGSDKGSVTTPPLSSLNGKATLTFKAAAWNNDNEQTELILSLNGGGNLSNSSVTMAKGAWQTYEITIINGTPTTQLTFAGKNKSNSRFFLDEVKITTNSTYIYTTSPTCGEIITDSQVFFTSTKGECIKTNIPIELKEFNRSVTIIGSCDNANNHFTIEQLDNINNGIHVLTIAYTPTEYNITETAIVTLTASNGATASFEIIGHSLPEHFAIVVEKDGKHFALPANMPSAGTYEGYEVKVEDNTVAVVPSTYLYSLSAVHSSRYDEYGSAVRFVGNDDKCLWASVSKSSPTSIRNYAELDNAKSNQYEWNIHTNNGKTYTIASTATEGGRSLRMRGTHFGLYTTGIETFQFLPIQSQTYTPRALSSKFSVAANKKVQFSSGNLQYHTGNRTWRFAEHQYDYIGEDNINVGDTAKKIWIDMFGWSTDNSNNNYGVNPSNANKDYEGLFVDWGTSFSNEWYTLSKDEWQYLLHNRQNAPSLQQLASIEETFGILLFPDDWIMPNEVNISEPDEYGRHPYTIEDWRLLEAAGAVFLPAAGRRTGGWGNVINKDQIKEQEKLDEKGFYRNQHNTNEYCYYWTSTPNNTNNTVYYIINCKSLGNDQYEYALPQLWYEKGRYGQSVRLVRECVKADAPKALPSTFSVSATEKVQFSAGNLQYHTGEDIWRFAPEQYDVIGQPNTNIGNPDFKDWIDMFGWSTDNLNNNYGVNPSNDQKDYNGSFVDWGILFSNEWYTLSKDEWYYLLHLRPNASSLQQLAKINEVVGVLLFPDEWVMPIGIETNPIEELGVLLYPYTLDQWKKLEAAGVVFLPAAGRRTGGWGNKIVSPHIEDKTNPDYFDSEGYYRWQDNTNYYGYYWTSTKEDDKTYYLITCEMSNDGETGKLALPQLWKEDGRYGQSVRLVRKYAPLQILEWKENSIVIMYNGNATQTATITIDNMQKGETKLSNVQKDIAVYELPAEGLVSSPNQQLEIAIGTSKTLITIPYIAVGDDVTSVPDNSDLIILKGATFTANGKQLRNVTIYGGGKLIVDKDNTLTTNTLTLRIGGVIDGNYDFVYPEFILNGTWVNTTDIIHLDYLTTKEQYYTFVAPFEIHTKDIHYPIDIYGNNVTAENRGSFEFQYYDGAARATGATGWKVVEEDATNGATLYAGQGYTFLGMPKKVNGTRQTFGIHRIPMKVSADEAMKHESEQQSVPLSVHLTDKNNYSGWNLIGNPYMATITGLTNEDIQVGKLVHTYDANGNWTGGWHWDEETIQENQRFLVIPSNDGLSYEAVQTSNAQLPAFKNFFVQISNKEANALLIPNETRIKPSLAPSRREKELTKRDIEVAIVLEQDAAHTDQLDLLLNNAYTTEFDNNADFTKMMNATNLNLYGVHTYDNLSFVALDRHSAQQSISIGYQVPAEGEYLLRMSGKPYVMLDQIEAIYITDHEMSPKVTVDILAEPYIFHINQAETNHTRFTMSIKLKADDTTDYQNITIEHQKPCKFIYQGQLYIMHDHYIFNATGQLVSIMKE